MMHYSECTWSAVRLSAVARCPIDSEHKQKLASAAMFPSPSLLPSLGHVCGVGCTTACVHATRSLVHLPESGQCCGQHGTLHSPRRHSHSADEREKTNTGLTMGQTTPLQQEQARAHSAKWWQRKCRLVKWLSLVNLGQPMTHCRRLHITLYCLHVMAH